MRGSLTKVCTHYAAQIASIGQKSPRFSSPISSFVNILMAWLNKTLRCVRSLERYGKEVRHLCTYADGLARAQRPITPIYAQLAPAGPNDRAFLWTHLLPPMITRMYFHHAIHCIASSRPAERLPPTLASSKGDPYGRQTCLAQRHSAKSSRKGGYLVVRPASHIGKVQSPPKREAI